MVPPPGLPTPISPGDPARAAGPFDLQQPMGWAPFLSGNKSAGQAGKLLCALTRWEAQKSINPQWGVHFFQDAAKLERQEGFEADMMRLLRGQGYLGPSTMGIPKVTMKTELEAMQNRGAPSVGAGLAMAAAAAPQANADWQAAMGATGIDERWDAQLPADTGRAAPEIYRAL